MKREEAAIRGVYAVYGNDGFRKAEVTHRICELAAKHGAEEGATRFDSDADLSDVLDEVRTYSLLGGRRLVVVEGADAFISKHRAALERYCAEPVDSGTLVLVCDSLPANTRLHKIIAKAGEVTECKQLRGPAINTWIVQHARSAYGKTIDPRAAGLLRELAGDELGALDGELGKLALFVRDRAGITAEDIEALVGRHREEDIFKVTDAMASGDTAGALTQWERVLATDRAAPARAVGGLAWGIRRLLDLKLKAMSGTPMHILAKQAYTQPNILEHRLARVTVSTLQTQLSELLDADVASKTGLCAADSAIEKFIIKHSAGGSTRRTA